MRLVAFFIALCILSIRPEAVCAQTFEAASIHPLAPGAKPDGDAARMALDPSGPETDPAPSLLSVDATLVELVISAYGIRDAGLQTLAMKQFPDWAIGDTFHVTARGPAGATIAQMRIMLQQLLREQFALVTHEETRPTQVYLLQIDPKQVLRLTPHPDACDDKCGTHITLSAAVPGAVQVRLTGQTLDQMAGELGGFALSWAGLTYGPVVNATSLQGRYDATITFTPIYKADAESMTTLMDAVRHDLGLTLQKGNRPITQRVIDHMERPAFD